MGTRGPSVSLSVTSLLPSESFFCFVVVSTSWVWLGLTATKQVPWASVSASFWLLSFQLPTPLLAAFPFKSGAESSCLAMFRLQVIGISGTAHLCLARALLPGPTSHVQGRPVENMAAWFHLGCPYLPKSMCACVLNHFSHIWLSAIPWTLACQAPLFMGILQARILEWVAMLSHRASSWPRNWTCSSSIFCIGRRVLYPQCHLGSPHQRLCCNPGYLWMWSYSENRPLQI